jgi:hypothetical protein
MESAEIFYIRINVWQVELASAQHQNPLKPQTQRFGLYNDLTLLCYQGSIVTLAVSKVDSFEC